MADPATIGAVGTIIISVLSILGGYLLKMHIKKCRLCNNIGCECSDNKSNDTQPNSPSRKTSSSFL